MPPGERLPAGWASAVGMGGSGEVDTLKNQLREAQMANNDMLAQMKATETSWRKCIEEAEQKEIRREAKARQELERCKAKVEKRRPPKSPAVARLLRKLKRNVAREMSDAQQGFVIQKVTEKHGKTEVRRVAVPQTQPFWATREIGSVPTPDSSSGAMQTSPSERAPGLERCELRSNFQDFGFATCAEVGVRPSRSCCQDHSRGIPLALFLLGHS
eukprot:s1279_g3.t1